MRSAYLDVEQILAVAKECGCDAIHPGYGFLSENVEFARRCAEEGITFVGPPPETLEIFGEKAQARALAERCGVHVLPDTKGPVTLEQAKAFLSSLRDDGSMMIKAVAGGGGRGMRAVFRPEEVEDAYTRCQSEALKALGNGDVYVEQLMVPARHIEVQVIGDGSGHVSHLGERECTIQRRHQKLVEITPCPGLSPDLRARIIGDAVRLAEAVSYHNVGTFEFLVNPDAMQENSAYAFIETNPRLQVEHTVTEEVTGIDIVKSQLQLAAGRSLEELGLKQADVPEPRGFAVQVRINMETMDPDGTIRPASGTLAAFEVPSGHGVRTDTCGYVGYRTNPKFDSLLAKLIGHSTSSNFADAVAKTYRALCEFKVDGVRTNIPFLQSLLQHPDFMANHIHTGFVEDHIEALVEAKKANHPRLFFDHSTERARAGAKVDEIDPLAVLDYGQTGSSVAASPATVGIPQEIPAYDMTGLEGAVVMKARMQGTVVSIHVKEGELVREGQQVMIMDSMKMEHVIRAEISGLVIAAQRSRRSLEDLIQNTSADGLVVGIGRVNGDLFDDKKARCIAMSYDYMVLAGTQGMQNHKKKDRMFELAKRLRIPVVFFTEGGGGRPGDTDASGVAGLDCMAFHLFGRLSGLVPLVGINSGRCFAGNAAILGCCDVIIATENSNIGMGGPAMIEGGGLGVFRPEEIGPMGVQVPNGVVDIAVADEDEGVRVAKKYLSYFQGPLTALPGTKPPDSCSCAMPLTFPYSSCPIPLVSWWDRRSRRRR